MVDKNKNLEVHIIKDAVDCDILFIAENVIFIILEIIDLIVFLNISNFMFHVVYKIIIISLSDNQFHFFLSRFIKIFFVIHKLSVNIFPHLMPNKIFMQGSGRSTLYRFDEIVASLHVIEV